MSATPQTDQTSYVNLWLSSVRLGLNLYMAPICTWLASAIYNFIQLEPSTFLKDLNDRMILYIPYSRTSTFSLTRMSHTCDWKTGQTKDTDTKKRFYQSLSTNINWKTGLPSQKIVMSQSQVIEYAVGLTFYYQVTARVCVRVCTRARAPTPWRRE